MKRRTWIRPAVYAALTLAGAVLAGWIDLHAAEVQASVAVIAGFAFALAALDPRRAWLWGAMIGLSVPVAHAIVRMAGIALSYSTGGYGWTFLALIPAAIAATFGALVGFSVRHAEPSPRT